MYSLTEVNGFISNMETLCARLSAQRDHQLAQVDRNAQLIADINDQLADVTELLGQLYTEFYTLAHLEFDKASEYLKDGLQ